MDIIKFKNQTPVRMQVIKGEPWFVAKDICDILGIVNSRDALSRLRENEKGVAITDTLGGKQEMTTVNESGMYALIFQSRKPAAQDFRYWVTSEVLPALRKYGRYAIPGSKEQVRIEAGYEKRHHATFLRALENHITDIDEKEIAAKLKTNWLRVDDVLKGRSSNVNIETELVIRAERNTKLRQLLNDQEWREEIMNNLK